MSKARLALVAMALLPTVPPLAAQVDADAPITVGHDAAAGEAVESLFHVLERVAAVLIPDRLKSDLDSAMARAIAAELPNPTTNDCGLFPGGRQRYRSKWPQSMRAIGCGASDDLDRGDRLRAAWVIPAITRFVRSVDPLGDVRSAEEWQGTRDPGEPAAIGISVYVKGDAAMVHSIRRDSPFRPLGLKAGDAILAIDGVSVNGESLETIASRLRGPVGSEASLDVRRGSGPPFRITAKRVLLGVEEVSVATRDGISLFAFLEFGMDRAESLRKAIESKHRNAKALVIDLRGNTGGLLTEVIAAADLFISEGRIARIEGKEREAENFDAQKGWDFNRLPLFVLVDRQTSSGAEILAAALQDRAGATVIGEPTFKSSPIHTVFPISRNWWMKLTTARVIRPNGKPIDGEGVTPDMIVDPQNEMDWPDLAMDAIEARLATRPK